MSKSATKYVVKIHKPDGMPALHIVDQHIGSGGIPDGCVATVSGGPGGRVTREQIVSLRDQINQWLGVLCTECGHDTALHRDDDGGPVTATTVFTYCEAGNCSCGMRSR